ncbi:hypothetical protein TREVI0001_1046 [Treponema vincentii ATCC 35580]|uniref:Uncharacterized protein n=1 Tax=Treponema vincentii ATCC 35580 TaxID=596324 RepID=C8PSK8_9SPIR|nr:hypothetical protein TREVI0001_1046 [Treponema vincentii ATCC 35580]
MQCLLSFNKPMNMKDVLKTVQINNHDAERWGIKPSYK